MNNNNQILNFFCIRLKEKANFFLFNLGLKFTKLSEIEYYLGLRRI